MSLNLYSDQNGHWGTMIYRKHSTRGRLYHVRSDSLRDPDKFYYEDREQPVEPPLSFGRSVLARYSEGESQQVKSAIRQFAEQDENIPTRSQGRNCQTFTTGIFETLESQGLLPPGHADYFKQFHGIPGAAIASSLLHSGRSWIPSEHKPHHGPVDARFGDAEQRRAPGRLNLEAYSDIFTAARFVPRKVKSPQGQQWSPFSDFDSPRSRSRGSINK